MPATLEQLTAAPQVAAPLVSRTILVGCGGTGAVLAPSLVRMLHFHPRASAAFTVIDGDTYEGKNLSRQMCTPQDIGLNKAERLHASLTNMFPQIEDLDYHPMFLQEHELTNFLTPDEPGATLIIMAVDNMATRQATTAVLDDYAGDFLWISPGNSDHEGDPATAPMRASLLWYGQKQSAKIGIDPRVAFESFEEVVDEIPVAVDSCAGHAPSNPQLIAANFLGAALTLALVQNYLDERDSELAQGMATYCGRTFRGA